MFLKSGVVGMEMGTSYVCKGKNGVLNVHVGDDSHGTLNFQSQRDLNYQVNKTYLCSLCVP